MLLWPQNSNFDHAVAGSGSAYLLDRCDADPNEHVQFYPRDAMLARILAMVLCLSVCVCLSQVGVLLNWLDGTSWFLARRLPSTSHTLCFKEINSRIYKNKGTSLELFP